MRFYDDFGNGRGYYMEDREIEKACKPDLYSYLEKIKNLMKEKQDVEYVSRMEFEFLHEFAEVVDKEVRAKYLHPKHIFRNAKEKAEWEKVIDEILTDYKENVVEYMVMCCSSCVYSWEEENLAIREACQNIIDGLDRMTPAQQRAWRNSLHPERKAPTLADGYIVLVFIMFIEGFFFLRWHLWAMTIAIFLAWRKKQQDIYNGRGNKD